MTTRTIRLDSPQEALELLGEQDAQLRRMEREFGVQMYLRQDIESSELSLEVKGSPARVEKALRRLRHGLSLLRQGRAAAAPRAPAGLAPVSLNLPPLADGIYRSAFGALVRPRTPNQARYVEAIAKHDLVFGLGPAGTGKTFLAVACALRELESRQAHRIILSRPVVEAGERLGFLPGDLLEKVNPYLKPLYDAFFALLGPERFRIWRETEVLEIVPLAYMRGRTFEDAFIILDEAQNTTPEQMKMFLTRMGSGSKIVVTGDTSQSDLGERTVSGLARVVDILQGVEGVAIHRLGEEDVVRHPLVKRIIRAYADRENR
ncbi:MAG: PhoH family protein [Elusimicrobia bacterium]|nr:PhoH family protein [Elusimicrobiota bacterium]MDE2236397.1 PhoH family protein [Elusimicrobiota bacterium]MDE2426545.1 PhoH family protein [Elusimicrobiota bacterium]